MNGNKMLEMWESGELDLAKCQYCDRYEDCTIEDYMECKER